jgi:2-oxoglutarate-Fe(II)-dependent oxygenase superfamily protein
LLEDLRRGFSREHYVRLPGFLDPSLFATTASQVAEAEFEVRTSAGVGSEWLMKPNPLAATLNWLLNAPELIQAVRRVAGCDEIGLFAGRVYRMDPSSGQSFEWHDDRESEARRLALSVNLGDRPHAGGVLRIRRKTTPQAMAEVPNEGPGDAVLFRVDDDLEHCVTPVAGSVPRLAFSGWFSAGPSYYALLLRQLAGDSARPAS